MKKVTLIFNYRKIEDLIDVISEPNRSICIKILEDNRKLFETARGSTHNHQTWDGGYIDHITDGMNLIPYLFQMLYGTGRPLPFSMSDALLIFFIHDLEKPWRILVDNEGRASNQKGITTKEEFAEFRNKKLQEYGLVLTDAQANAFKYIEGEYKDYSSERRVSNELAAFCHMVDTWCARGWYDYPKAENDEWIGAHRVRTT